MMPYVPPEHDSLWRRIRPHVLLLAMILLTSGCLCVALHGQEYGADFRPIQCPPWLLRGLMAVETSSYYRADGTVVYVNQKRGLAGERGLFQAMPATLRQYGYSPSLYEQDTAYAINATRAILLRYYATTGSWDACAAAWRKGLSGRNSTTATTYAAHVRAAGMN